ncbi:phenylacetate--CoA ligase family protein [Mycobacterium sp. M26]|uniref:phenylacetate--CoA ligase family protein n=1 Tax=Mycobacterium sp. M26 TaxID=1762962 RepID=UPI00073E2F1C|nr:phenylacetate--CoA ligase family protein [Mycobacterium sp. M26]
MAGQDDLGRRFFEPGIETARRAEITGWQERRILELVPYAWERSAFYRELWSSAGVDPSAIRSLDDFTSIVPTFSKSDLKAYRDRTGDPFAGLLCVDPAELTSITSTSGTTSLPEPLPEVWDVAPPLPMMGARALWEIGLRPGDRVLVPSGSFRNYWDSFCHMLGLVPVFTDCWIGQGEEILQTIERHRIAYLQLFLPTVMEFEALEAKYDVRAMLSSLKGAAFAGQPLGAALSRKVREDWGVNLFTYTSAGDTGLAWESADHDGYHLQEDTVFPEFLDPATGLPIADGEVGELVATDLDNAAAPYIRFRSEDLVRVSRAPAPSGRTHARMWVLGRVGDELRIADRSLVLADIWKAVEAQPECSDALFQVVKYADAMDRLRIRIGYAPDRTADIDELSKRATVELETALGVPVDAELLAVDKILESSTSVAKFPRTVKA